MEEMPHFRSTPLSNQLWSLSTQVLVSQIAGSFEENIKEMAAHRREIS